MKKLFITFFIPLFTATAFSQVGINTSAPKTTLDVNGKTDTSGNLLSTDVTGLQAPRLTRAELTAKGNALYGTAQKGALVYITDISGGDAVSQRVNIYAIGYYYFDGALWQKLAGSGAADGDAWGVTCEDQTSTIGRTGSVGVGTTTPGSTLAVNGSFGANHVQVTSANYTVTDTDYFMRYSGTTNSTFTLPVGISSTCNCEGRIYEVVNKSNFTVTVNTVAGEQIDETSSVTVPAGFTVKIVNRNLSSGGSYWTTVLYAANIFSDTEGSRVQKLRYLGSPDPTKTIVVDGFYEMRINSAGGASYPIQIRLVANPGTNHVIRYNRHAHGTGVNNVFVSSITFTSANWNTYQNMDTPGMVSGSFQGWEMLFSSASRNRLYVSNLHFSIGEFINWQITTF